MRSSNSGPTENDFDAYLGFRECFWERFNWNIIDSGDNYTLSQKVRLCTIWNGDRWKSRGGAADPISPY